MSEELTIVPANEVSWEQLETVFGTRGEPAMCHCQRYKMAFRESWASLGREELAARFRVQTECGNPGSGTTTGLVLLEPGQTAVGDFGVLGQVSVRFSP